MRITKKHLLEDFELLKKHTRLNLEIEWAGAPQLPRIHLILPATLPGGTNNVSDLSPKLTMRDMHLWIEEFSDGWVKNAARIREKMRQLDAHILALDDE